MRYEIIIKPRAEKELDRLPLPVCRRVLDRMEGLRSNPRPPGARKLAGDESFWRVRVGDYRIVYEVQDDRLTVTVLKVGHRKEVYRGDK